MAHRQGIQCVSRGTGSGVIRGVRQTSSHHNKEGGVVEKEGRFPYRFFVVTFAWSWLIWLPLVLAGAGIIPLGKDLLSALTVPWVALGVFGPAAGALYSLRTLRGKGAVRQYLRGLLDLRFGWRAWIAPPLVLGGTTWLAWVLPELWGEPRLEMLLPSVWAFLPYLLLMIFLGGGQEELGWRGYILDPLEERLGPWLGNLVLGVVWAVWHVPLFLIPGTSQIFRAVRRVRARSGRLFLLLRRDAPGRR